MLGAVAGDVIGSVWEHRPIETTDFPLFLEDSRFTDDTVCTVAVADWLMDAATDPAAHLRFWVRRYPDAGYGGMFLDWALADDAPAYGSWGNGAPMRSAPVGWVARDTAEANDLAEASAQVSHDHPDAVLAAQAVAASVLAFRDGAGSPEVRQMLELRFGYDLGAEAAAWRGRGFDVSAAGSTPAALACALEAEGWEQAVRLAVSLGGDADTLGCMAGAVAEARFGVPPAVAAEVVARLPSDLRDVIDRFRQRFVPL